MTKVVFLQGDGNAEPAAEFLVSISKDGSNFYWRAKHRGKEYGEGEEQTPYTALLSATRHLKLEVRDWMTLENLSNLSHLMGALV